MKYHDRNIRFLIFILILEVLAGCTEIGSLPFSIDPQTGTYSFGESKEIVGSISIEVNGENPLLHAFVFSGKDSTTCIRTIDDLDLIVVFKSEGELTGSVDLQIRNIGESKKEITGIDLFHWRRGPGTNCSISGSVGTDSVQINETESNIFITTSTTPLWPNIITASDTAVDIRVDLQDCPLILLTEEEVHFHSIHFSSSDL